jgi:flagellar basal-body rod protein FlgC
MSDLRDAMNISASGMRVQTKRIGIVTQNLANAESTGDSSGSQPYRRQIITFDEHLDKSSGIKIVTVKKITHDQNTPLNKRYQPEHPAADRDGYVLYPNVNRIIESRDMDEARRSYEANLNALDMSKNMLLRTIDMLR